MTEIFPVSDPRPRPKGQRVAIVGSRDYPRLDRVREIIRQLPQDSVVVSGGARGVDETAVQAAKAQGFATLEFHADWRRHGRKAGPLRNAEIVAHADRVVAFWNGTSRGTLNTIAQAHRAGLSILVFDAQGEILPVDVALRAAEASGVTAAIDAATNAAEGHRDQ